MNFIRRFLGGGIDRAPGVQNGASLLSFRAQKENVNEQTAMQISAVWAAVQLKSKTLSSLDIHCYRMTAGGREDLRGHWLTELFKGKINRYQTRVEFFETVGLNLYLTGNAYCIIQRIGSKVVGLLPIMSSQVEVEILTDGSVAYTYNDGRNIRVYDSSNIWHLKLFGNGVQGLSPLQYAANSIGIAISGEKWASNIVGNGGKPTGVLMFDKILTKEQREQLKSKFKGLKEGADNSLMVLEAGMKYEQISLSPQDVQLLEARRFQVEDIARFFDVPSVMINDTSGSTVWGSGIQQIIEGWYKLSFRPELERIETSIIANLLSLADQESISVEFNFEELLRTDFRTRVETGARAVGAGLMSRNEWRKREWLPEVDGAGELTVQVNLLPLDELNKLAGGQQDDQQDAD
jgi:HK97 family phage portal protein